MSFWVAGAVVVGSIGSAVISSNAAKSAAQTQANAANAANQTQQDQFNQTNANQAPYRATGQQALSALSQYYGLGGMNPDGTPSNSPAPDQSAILQNQPGYQFQMQQGTQAVNRNLSAQGLLQSGAAGKALTNYGQGLAQNYAQQYTGGLSNLAGLGQTATQSTAAAGANAANQISSNQIFAGNAQAQGQIGSANAISAAIGNLSGIYGNYQTGNFLKDQMQNGQANQQASQYVSNYQTPQFNSQLTNPYQNPYGYTLGGP